MDQQEVAGSAKDLAVDVPEQLPDHDPEQPASGDGGVFERPMNLGLDANRFVAFRPAAGDKEMKLMTGAAGAMAGAGIAGVDPKRHAVGEFRFAGIRRERLLLSADCDLEAEAVLVPGDSHVGEVLERVDGGEILEPARFRQIDDCIAALERHFLDRPARMRDANQKSGGDEGHGLSDFERLPRSIENDSVTIEHIAAEDVMRVDW